MNRLPDDLRLQRLAHSTERNPFPEFYGPGRPQRPGLGKCYGGMGAIDAQGRDTNTYAPSATLLCGQKTYEGLFLVGALVSFVVMVPAAFSWGRKATRA